MTPLTPALNEMCAAIFEATPSEFTWEGLQHQANLSFLWARDRRDATILQATAALALAEKRERGLREALGNMTKMVARYVDSWPERYPALKAALAVARGAMGEG